MGENKQKYLKNLKKAEMFIEDYLPLEYIEFDSDFIKENFKIADEHLKAVHDAASELEDVNKEEFETNYKNRTDIARKTLSHFIKDARIKLKNNQEKVTEGNIISPTLNSKSKENKQVPRLFGKPPNGVKYKIGFLLPCENSGCNLYIPIREFKSLTFDSSKSEADKENAFVTKLAKFAGACINAGYNGTIYFGVADEKGKGAHKHGEIVGMNIKYSETVHFEEWITKHFKAKNPVCLHTCSPIEQAAFYACISPLYVIELEDSNRIVLEVDIEPSSEIIKNFNFKVNFPNDKTNGIYYVRNASSSYSVTDKKELRLLLEKKLPELRRNRQELEKVQKEIPVDNNIRLHQLICKGEPRIFYNKYHYFLVVNSICEESCCRMKSIQDLEWIASIQWKAIFDFNPNTQLNGVLKLLNDCSDVIDKPLPITMEQIEESFDTELKEHYLLNSYNNKTIHITCCKKEEKNTLFSDWRGNIMPILQKMFYFLTGPSRVPTQNDIAIIVLCCSKQKEKEFLSFLSEVSLKYNILKEFSILSQKDLHLKATADSILEAYGKDSETRGLPKLLKRNSLCIQWNAIDSFVKKLTSDNTIEVKHVQTSNGIPIPVKPKIIEKFNGLGIYLLASNECEELKNKSSEELRLLYNNTMKDFLRGKDPSWNLCYFAYNKFNIGKVIPVALIEREMVLDISKKIEILAYAEDKCIDLVGIGHLPGAGASTIAMNVLWCLKEKFRCVKIEGANTDSSSLENLSMCLLELRSFGENEKLVLGEEVLECLPLLILMDDTDYEVAKDFQAKIHKEVLRRRIKFRKTLGIIIFVQSNKLEEKLFQKKTLGESYPNNCFNMPDKFTNIEREMFLKKLEEFESDVESEHSQSNQLQLEDMLGFLILINSFERDTENGSYKSRISKIASKIGFFLDGYPNEKLLLLILAIFKFYGDTNLSSSHAAIILGYSNHHNVSDHTKMLVRIKNEPSEFGNCEVLEMTHCQVAEVVMESFFKSEGKSVIDVLYDVFENKAIMNHRFVKEKLLKDIRYMVIRRKFINDVKRDKKQRFSTLILQIKNKNPDLAIQFLQKVITTLENLNMDLIDTGSSMIHQTLSRLYLDLDKLDLAKASAREAIKINNKNFRYYDTLAQVYKTEVKNNFKRKDNKTIIMNDFLCAAYEAIQNFKKSQLLFEEQNNRSTAKVDFIEDTFDENDFIYRVFQGYFSEATVQLCIAEKLIELAEDKEKDDVRSFISAQKGDLRVVAARYEIDLNKYASLLKDIYGRTNSCMRVIMRKLDSNVIRDYKTADQLRKLRDRCNNVFKTSIFNTIPDVILSKKKTYEYKMKQVKFFFDINLCEYLYCVRNNKLHENKMLSDIVKALLKLLKKENRDIEKLDMNILVCLLNSNLAKNSDPLLKFDVACSISKHLTIVDSEIYEYYFWYTVFNWPTENEVKNNTFAKTYDEELLVKCVHILQKIYYSSVQKKKNRIQYLTHASFYKLRNEIGYDKFLSNSDTEKLTGKIVDINSVEYLLPRGTRLNIRCANLRLNRGSSAQNVTFELGFTLSGPVAYSCNEFLNLKSYNDDRKSEET